MRYSKDKFHSRVVKFSYPVICGVFVLVGIANANGQNQTSKARVAKFHAEQVQQLVYRDYRGVRLGMTADETRSKLGSTVLKSDDLDYYIFSENETAQIAYSAVHKVVTISVDYTGGVGAPDYRTVVGAGLLERPDGSVYRMIHYEAEGFWVSYNKSAGTAPVVTITLQVIAK
jgi:hypothetical protein